MPAKHACCAQSRQILLSTLDCQIYRGNNSFLVKEIVVPRGRRGADAAPGEPGVCGQLPDVNTDQAPGGDFSRERVLRPLFRLLSECAEPGRRASVSCSPPNAERKRIQSGPSQQQS